MELGGRGLNPARGYFHELPEGGGKCRAMVLVVGIADMAYYEEHTWNKLGPALVEQGEKAKLDRLTPI